MKESEKTGELYKALFEAVKGIETLKKESKGYGYSYLNLESLIAYLKPILLKQGLYYIQTVGGESTITTKQEHYDSGYTTKDKKGNETFHQFIKSEESPCVVLTTRLIHGDSGQWLEDSASIPLTDMKGVNRSQAAGAAITYLRRYSLTALFGIAENDTDGLTMNEIKEKEKANPKPLHKSIMAELEKAWSYYSPIDVDKANFIQKLMNGEKQEYLGKVLDTYREDLVTKVFEGEKQLDKALEV